ncbi:SgcJ/EcaC family oxidoreductase [Streptoalloteichus hindustanus]|uniref:DUF4440 domain-containing protein n=1 Tax=Streptoalloteichus hindustanus TaxID=2017 RepID=A0A1M5HG64_STRHI|nr:SgcJ/EcaC family oxidoreductase [Streptoalloteichus hindustanus]SHG14935.1 conserved hypothetical protein [Streptoalloteichus hindustanus]
MATTAPQPPVIEDGATDHEQDIAEIRRIVADVEKGFNTNDAELMNAHFAANATVVNAMGVQISGWDALLDSSRKGLSGFLSKEYAQYHLANVLFLRPDVAIAHKHAWATTPEGERIDAEHAMNALYVLVKEQGRWWVAARQNTLVVR